MKQFQLIVILAAFLLTRCDKCENDDIIASDLPLEGLLAWYPFNMNTDDESGNMHDGIVHGCEFVSDRSGVSARALAFDGVSDYVKLDRMNSFNASLESFSVSFWIRSSTSNVTDYETVMKTINFAPAGTMFSVEVHRGKSGSLVIGVIRLDIRDEDGKYFTIYVTRPDIFDNEWHNVTFIISSAKSNQGDVFIDGELESKDEYFVSVGSQSPVRFELFENELVIGAGNNRGTIETYFRGSLDEVVFYNRPLRTTEILQLFNR